jgi:hypothetical protein
VRVVSPELAPWLALVGLGLFHGINPAMGWLFAVALGLNRHSQTTVLVALVPIALGHAAAVAVAIAAVLALGLVIDHAILLRLSGLLLIGWALWHALRGHRQRVRVGMQTGLVGLGLWSFLMASAHGAGLMVAPVLIGAGTGDAVASSHGLAEGQEAGFSVPVAAVGLVLHVSAMVAVAGAVALLVYTRFGVGVLRRWWVNTDAGWAVAFVLTGTLTLFT